MTKSTDPLLSACLIVRDEEEMLPACLETLGFCDEIVVVDSGSRDRTVDIALAAGATVVEEPWHGFAAQRNIALAHANGEWVLEIDADERVSAELAREISSFVTGPLEDVAIAGIPRREVFLGRALGRSAKYPKYSHRLFRREAYRHDEARTVHEGLVPRDTVAPLQGELLHLMACTWREAIGDAWRYARLEAQQMHPRRTAGGLLHGAVVRPTVKLFYRLFIDGGWRDGALGLGRIALECSTDSCVWALSALGGRAPAGSHSGVAPDEHYGARRFRVGSARIVGLALDQGSVPAAAGWLSTAREKGADVSLIALPATAAVLDGVRVRASAGRGLFPLIRALDAEEQLRSIDAVVAFGPRAYALSRLVPRHLLGSTGRASPPNVEGILASAMALRTDLDEVASNAHSEAEECPKAHAA